MLEIKPTRHQCALNQEVPPMTNEVRHRHFGVVHIPVNYTLGRGVPEALGNRVQAAATTAFLTLEGAGNSHDVAHCEINVDEEVTLDCFRDQRVCVSEIIPNSRQENGGCG